MTLEEEDKALQVYAGLQAYEEWTAHKSDTQPEWDSLSERERVMWIAIAITAHEAMHSYVDMWEWMRQKKSKA